MSGALSTIPRKTSAAKYYPLTKSATSKKNSLNFSPSNNPIKNKITYPNPNSYSKSSTARLRKSRNNNRNKVIFVAYASKNYPAISLGAEYVETTHAKNA